jgi:DNA repair protein RAD5
MFQEMDPPSTLLCDLRPYQKQALCWMSKLEKGTEMEKAAKTLHPCWNAYRIADKYDLICLLWLKYESKALCTFYLTMHCRFILANDRRATAVYVNAFSGEATAEFPSALQITRGGVCHYLYLYIVKENVIVAFFSYPGDLILILVSDFLFV